MHKVVTNILPGSVVTQIVLGRLTIYPPFCEFPIAYMCQLPKIMKIG